MYYVYDAEGFYLEDSLEEVANSTTIQPPQPCWRPRFLNGEWFETASETDKEGINEALIQERIALLEKEIQDLQAKLTMKKGSV